ncbi:NAD(P)-dependent oxidoreductase [Actinacidiphila sp. ITFR-21]|uniref:NAD(P)-dependent oxidoreductase n=1 Tax=Actinacidiphila sp. ITFR-21 TaxID=3075199 RepID=UPI0028891199|nr:NAD(P)-dependent oxidoreductase [Streptomyces sp. ITFR-21]WNI15373.1 NAD(P)-dependent oxidoreductase [Streptomyces sp. ITFR-21]
MSSHDTPLTVTVLGTGLMGAGMARSLVAAGHRVRAWNRTTARALPLAEHGVEVVADPAEAVRGADAVLTMLLDGPAVLDVMRTAAPVLAAGTVWAQTSTVGPSSQRELAALAAEHGLLFLDSPVLGTKSVAETGKLTVTAAGPAAARPVADRVFDAIGGRTVWLDGDAADSPASALKLVLNNWVLALTVATGETLALAKGLGVDPARFFDAIEGGAMDVAYLRIKGAAILGGDFSPSFTVEGAEKDLRLIVAAGESAGVTLDAAAAGAERMRRAGELGYAGEDMAAAYFASFGPDGPPATS